MTPNDPAEIRWAVGMPHRAWYGARTERVVLHNTAYATGRDRDYIPHLLCRLSPTGTLELTGKVDEQWR